VQAVDLVSADGKQRLRLELAVEGQTLATAWEAFLDRWFDYFDRDGDGYLSRAEAGRMFALPVPGRQGIALDFDRADANGDGKVTRFEMIAYYVQAGFRPIVTVIQPLSLEDMQVAEAFFRHLGPDKTGRLTLEKLKRASAVLAKLDENEDDVLTVGEVLSLGVDPSLKAPGQSEWYWVAADKQSSPAFLSLTIGNARDPAPRILQTAKGVDILPAAPGAGIVRVRHGDVVLALGWGGDAAKAVTPTRQFVLAQFKNVAGKKDWVEKRHVDGDAALQIVAALFDHADRDGDGKLTLAELEQFFALVEQGMGSCFVLTIRDRGKNLFALLDADCDGRLTLQELRAAAGLLQKRLPVTGWLPNEVPQCLHITVQRGFAGSAFGPLPLVAAPGIAPVVPGGKAGMGPAWFQAMDRNGDGFVSMSEFLGPPELFRQLDLDGDGLISAVEAERAASAGRRRTGH
jgi:Ca2+-binding EF-hand superfamily protein